MSSDTSEPAGVPSHGEPVVAWSAADTVREMAGRPEAEWLTHVAELVRGWDDTPVTRRGGLCAERAPLLGDAGWDALVAGTVAALARRDGVGVPDWTEEPARFSPRFFAPVDLPSLRARAHVHAPGDLHRRGVLITIEDLAQEPAV